MAALLTDGKRGSVGQTAQLSPYSFPLQGLAGLPHRELWLMKFHEDITLLQISCSKYVYDIQRVMRNDLPYDTGRPMVLSKSLKGFF